MTKKKIKKKIKKISIKSFFLIWLKWSFIVVIILCSWISLHELSHAGVCKIIGGEPSLEQILPYPMINCDGLVIDNKLVVSPSQYFFYEITPYILALIILSILNFNKKIGISISCSLVIVILLDILWNYIGSIFYRTDFKNMAMISKPLFVLAVITSFIGVFLGFRIIKKRWKDIKLYSIQTVKKIEK